MEEYADRTSLSSLSEEHSGLMRSSFYLSEGRIEEIDLENPAQTESSRLVNIAKKAV